MGAVCKACVWVGVEAECDGVRSVGCVFLAVLRLPSRSVTVSLAPAPLTPARPSHQGPGAPP